MPHPKVKISDDSGNAVGVTDNRLNVNAYLSATPTIDIGDVSLLLGGTAADTNTGSLSAQTLRVTLAIDDPLTAANYIQLAGINTATTLVASLVQEEDDGHSSGDKGIMPFAVVNDGMTSDSYYAGSEGDYTPLQAAPNGALYMELGPTSLFWVKEGLETEDLQHSTGDRGFHVLGVRNDTLAALAGTDGDYTSLQVNAAGALYVDGSDHTQPISGTVTANLSATDNAVLDAMVVDLAAIEALLITIDSDTNTIQGAVSSNEMQVDVVGELPIGANIIGKVQLIAGTNAVGNVGHDITGGADGVTTVSSAGTDVVLASSTACKKIDIQAQTDNTGLIAVGFTGVDATEATGTGVILYAGDTYSLEVNNLNLIYIDSTVSGEGVRYTYFT